VAGFSGGNADEIAAEIAEFPCRAGERQPKRRPERRLAGKIAWPTKRIMKVFARCDELYGV